MSNTTLWDALGKTDPHHTKGFSRAGGFRGTAIKPMWALRRLTEQFGPVGEGWGTGKPEFQLVNGQEGEVLVYCTVAVWHGDRANVSYGVGGDKAIARNKNGLFHDDEAFKKAFTDATMNGFKALGVAADIHMGLFDDDKYVADMNREFAERPETISDEQRTELMALMDGLGFPVAELLRVSKIKDLRDLPADKFEGAKRWVGEQSKEKEPA